MSTTIRISEETKIVLNDLGGTFDKPDDVIQRLIKEAGYELPQDPAEEEPTERDLSPIERALDDHLPQSDWLDTPKQRDVVVAVAERFLELPSGVSNRRKMAQEYVLHNRDVKDIQTIQDQCGRRLFEGHIDVNGNRWTNEFERVLEEVEKDLRGDENADF